MVMVGVIKIDRFSITPFYRPIVNLYLFSWGNKSEFEALFDHLEHITIKTIPQPILEIYKKIYNIVTVWADLIP